MKKVDYTSNLLDITYMKRENGKYWCTCSDFIEYNGYF